MLYHDSNSQLGVEDRYLSEMKAMGRDAKTMQLNPGSPNASPRSTVLKRFQSNWNILINMGNSKSKEEESLLARTSREFWYADKSSPCFNPITTLM